VGREFWFPLFEFEYVYIPSLTSNNAIAVHEYLTLTEGHIHFSAEILKLLLEEK
jgi:hypothetical protein